MSITRNGMRRRYIGFVVDSKNEKPRIDKSEMIREIRRQCRNIFDKDCKEMGIYLVNFDGIKGIVRCNHVEKDNTIMLLESIDKVSSQDVVLKTVGTSGTIKTLVRKHMSS
jgi:RNase P/RNase MRP subunit POP5